MKTGVYVENLTEENVSNMKDVTQLLIKVCFVIFLFFPSSNGLCCSLWLALLSQRYRVLFFFFPYPKEITPTMFLLESQIYVDFKTYLESVPSIWNHAHINDLFTILF